MMSPVEEERLMKCGLQTAAPQRGTALWAIGFVAVAYVGGCTSERPIYYQIQSRYTVHDPQFPLTMGNLLGPPLLGGNSCKTLQNGDEIFPAMLDAIAGAKRSITFETFIYWQGAIGDEFSAAFCRRARAGVKVHVLLDWYGSAQIDHRYIDAMKRAGVEVFEYHPLHLLDPSSYGQVNHRTHRKILVVDGLIGFTGGVGIADEWRGHGDRPGQWRDNHYRVEGPVVGGLQAAFVDNWMQTTGEVLDGECYFPKLPSVGSEYAQVFRSSSQGGSENMQLLVLLSLAAAGKNVRIESAYFVPDDLTIRSLIAARRRGVSVEIIVPSAQIDMHVVRRASRARWGELLQAGVRIYEFHPTMFHCKQLIIDDAWVSVGSSNFDNRSFRLNDEANLNVLDGPFALKQVKVFEADRKQSREMTYEQWLRRPLMEKVLDDVAGIFAWEL